MTIDIPTNNTFVGFGGSLGTLYSLFYVDFNNPAPPATSVVLRLARGGAQTFGLPASTPLKTILSIYSCNGSANGTSTGRPVARRLYGQFDLADPALKDPTNNDFVRLTLGGAAVQDANADSRLSFFGELNVPDLHSGVQEWFAFDGAIGAGGHPPIAQVIIT